MTTECLASLRFSWRLKNSQSWFLRQQLALFSWLCPLPSQLQSRCFFRLEWTIGTLSCTLLLPSLFSCLYFPLSSGLQKLHSTCRLLWLWRPFSWPFPMGKIPALELGFLSCLLAYRKALVPGSMALLRVSQFKPLTPSPVESNNDSLNGLVLICFPWIFGASTAIGFSNIFFPASDPWKWYLPCLLNSTLKCPLENFQALHLACNLRGLVALQLNLTLDNHPKWLGTT